MAVLVTGGAGYIGSHMAWSLVDDGQDVVVLDNLSNGFEWAVAKEAEMVVGDVGDRDLLDKLLADGRIDAIVHFAGSIVVPESVTNPMAYYANNSVASATLIGAAIHHEVRHFIFSSTAAVYGSTDSMLVGEASLLSPQSPYGRSKLVTEWMLADAAAAHKFGYLALRYFNVSGADPQLRTGQSSRNATHLIKTACQVALGKRDHLTVFGTDYPTPDGTCIRDYIHVTDLVGAHLAGLEDLRRGGVSEVLNCGYGAGYSVLQVVEAMRRQTGVDFEVQLAGRRAGDAVRIVADPTLIMERLDWQPQWNDLDQIINHAVAWERQLESRGT